MEKVDTQLRTVYGPGEVYFDDIRRLHHAFNSVSDNVSIEADGYKYDNLEELYDSLKGKNIDKISLKIMMPNLFAIYISKERCVIGSFSSTIEYLGIFKAVELIVKSCEIRRNFFNKTMISAFILLLGIYIGIFEGNIYISVLLILISILYIIWTIRAFKNSPWRIWMISKNEKKGFWNENKDKVLLMLMGAAIGTVGTLAIKYLENGILSILNYK